MGKSGIWLRNVLTHCKWPKKLRTNIEEEAKRIMIKAMKRDDKLEGNGTTKTNTRKLCRILGMWEHARKRNWFVGDFVFFEFKPFC